MKWPVLQLSERREHMFNFVLLSQKRWVQFNSRIVRTHFASAMTLNNCDIIEETRSYIFRWRSRCRWRRLCLSSLLFHWATTANREGRKCRRIDSVRQKWVGCPFEWNPANPVATQHCLLLNPCYCIAVIIIVSNIDSSCRWFCCPWGCCYHYACSLCCCCYC